jgi:hypothetical protein
MYIHSCIEHRDSGVLLAVELLHAMGSVRRW